MADFDFILFAHDHPLFGADPCDPTDGQAADRTDGAVGICGDYAGGEPCFDPHAGQRHPVVFRPCTDFDGLGYGTGAFGPVPQKHQAPESPVREAGNSH